MSRYSYRVEKLLKESKSPSLDILLEKEGEEAEEATAAAEPSSDDAGGDEGIPDDAFDSEDDNEDKSGEAASSDEESEGADDESGGEGEDVNNKVDLEEDLAKLKRKVAASEEAGVKIKKASDEFPESIEGSLFDAIDMARAFESKLYNKQGIKAFIFEAEDDANEKIADSIESLQSALDSEENQLPDPYELAQIANKYFNRFDEVDRAIYIIKLVAIYFKKIINPDKDKVFDEFIDNFLAILQKDGINIELDHSQAVKYKTAVGARTAG